MEGTTRRADLAAIYAPIRDDLEAVESRFRDFLITEYDWLEDLATYVRGFSGKKLRPALVLLSARACGADPGDDHLRLAAVVEILHTATLVHDDVVDGSELRRGLQTLHRMWGMDASVLFGDFLFSLSFTLSSALGDPQINRILARTCNTMCMGELLQCRRKRSPDLTEEEYLRIVEWKTAALIGAACELGAYRAGAGEERMRALAEYGRCLGIAFQISDDVLDLTGDEEVVGKSLGTDYRGGKATLPILRVLDLARRPEAGGNGLADAAARLRSLIAGEESDDPEADRRSVLEALRTGDAVEYARERARKYSAEAKAALDGLDACPGRDSLVALADFVVDRRR